MTRRQAWHYFRAGSIECGPRYEWRDGYARIDDGGVLYPWHTRRACQSEAKRAGFMAVFHETEKAARAAQLDASAGPRGVLP